MELHDMAQYRVPRPRRVSHLAFPEDWRSRNVANDEQACRRGTRALGGEQPGTAKGLGMDSPFA